jgi:hypothetical protein
VRSQKNHFVKIVEYTHLSQNSCRHSACRPKTDGQSVGTRCFVNIVRGFLAACAFHVLCHNVGFSGNIFLQEGNYGFDPISSQAAWRLADNSFDSLAFVIGRLCEGFVDDERADEKCG